jgi:hypothetical protein
MARSQFELRLDLLELVVMEQQLAVRVAEPRFIELAVDLHLVQQEPMPLEQLLMVVMSPVAERQLTTQMLEW